MPRCRVLVLVTAVLLATGLWAAGPAQADSRTRKDRVGDVTSVPNHSDTEVRTAEPARREGDLDSTTVRHRRHVVVVVAHFRQLTPVHAATHFVVIRTDERVTRKVGIFAAPDDPQGTAYFMSAGGSSLSCPGLRHRIDHGADLVRVVVPRACLSRPRWVRGKVHTETVDPAKVYDDVAGGRRTGPWRFGPRVRR